MVSLPREFYPPYNVTRHKSSAIADANNRTVGGFFFFFSPGRVLGGTFYTAVVGAHTIRVSLWNPVGTRLRQVDVACSGPGVYTGTFATPYDITEADIQSQNDSTPTQFAITMWETSGSWNTFSTTTGNTYDEKGLWIANYERTITNVVGDNWIGSGGFSNLYVPIDFVGYAFAESADSGAPYLVNELPGDGYTDVSRTTSISVDVIDDNTGVDLSTLDAYVSGADAYRVGMGFVSPYDGLSSAITPTSVGGYDGYHIVLDRTTPYDWGETVTPRIKVDDFAGFSLDGYWNFDVIDDVNPPFFHNQFPGDGYTDVSRTTSIYVDILDEYSGVDLSTLDAYVNGADAYRIGVGFVSPYDGPSSSIIPTTFDGYDGYKIVLDRTTPYDWGATIVPRIKVNDFVGLSLDGYWSFDILDDVNPPYLTNQFPAPGAIGVPQATLISVDVVDEYSGVDLSTLDAYVNGADAYRVGMGFVPPYDGPLSDITPTTVDGYDGYHIVLDRTTLYNWGVTVTPRIKVNDFVGLSVDGSWSFDVADETPPAISNEDPAPNQTGVALESNISLDITDSESGVDAYSVVLAVDGYLAWKHKLAQPGFSVNVFGAIDGYKYVINPDTNFNVYSIVRVDVDAYDLYGNYLDAYYSFISRDTTSPLISNEIPSNGSSGISENTLIGVNIYSTGSGVNFSTIKAYVKGQIAYNGSFIAPFNGGSSQIVPAVVDGYDGYHLVIDKNTTYHSGDSVTVRIDALNKDGY